MLEEFKKFIMKGNVMDMAVGIIIGAAFGTVVSSLVADVVMPPIGLLLGGVDFANLFAVIKEGATPAPYATVDAAAEAGAVTINFGTFINHVISFLVVALAVFLLVKNVNKMQDQMDGDKEEEAEAPPEPSAEEKLLTEIRDALKSR